MGLRGGKYNQRFLGIVRVSRSKLYRRIVWNNGVCAFEAGRALNCKQCKRAVRRVGGLVIILHSGQWCIFTP